MAFPTRTGTLTTKTAGSTTQTLNFSSPAAGDMIVGFVAFGGNNTITMPAGWTIINQEKNRTDNAAFASIYRVCDGLEGTSVTATFAVNCVLWSQLWTIDAGTFTGTPVSATMARNGTANANPPAVDWTGNWGTADTLVFAAGMNVLYNSFAAGPASYSNYASYIGQPSSPPQRVAGGWADREVTAASEDPGTFTSNSSEWVAATVAIQGASAAGPSAAAKRQYRRNQLLEAL